MDPNIRESVNATDGNCGRLPSSTDYGHQIDSEDNKSNEDFHFDSNDSNLRRRKGKIMSCAKETIENASRLIRRRVPCTGHLMTPRRLWLNKIPTQCDVVIEFPENAPDDALRWLLSKIRSSPPIGLGLSIHVKAHDSTKRTAFYISSPINVLFKAAEDARLPKRLRNDLGGALKEFTTRESHCFAQTKDSDGEMTLFSSQERQWLVAQVLQDLRAGPTDVDSLKGIAAVAEGQSIVAAWQETGLITQMFPLHETRALTNLQSTWVRNVFAPQPLDDIAEYFGVKVALYFAWLGHYTCALGVPAVFGTLLWAVLWGRGQTAQDIGHVLFSLFNVAWASLYLEAWRRYSVELAFRWGTLSTPPDLLEPARPLYKGILVVSHVTGRVEPMESPVWKRRAFRYLISFPIIGLCLISVFIVMFVMLQLQDWFDDRNDEESSILECMFVAHQDWWDEKIGNGVWSCLGVVPKVLLAGAITLMDEAYFKLAVWLNDKENYRLQSKYENHLIGKVAMFQFVNSFLSLFYIAFYLRDQEKLKEQLAGLLISRQIIGNLRETAWPYFVEQWRLAKLSFKMWGALSPTQEKTITIDMKNEHETTPSQNTSSQPKRSIGQAEIESSLYKYDGTFSDHLEMLVQMGYVVLFSAAFPLAGICALANNLLEIRSDAFKLAHVHQRPFGQRVANIGTWQNALGLLGLAAVIVNCALIGLSGQVSRLWPGLTSAQTVILIVALEHFMLGLRSALTWLLPELPSWLAAEIAKAEHCRREMQCKGPSPRPTPPSPSSSMSLPQLDSDNNMISPGDTILVGEQSLGSHEAEEIIFEPILSSSPTYKTVMNDDLPLTRSSIDGAFSMSATKAILIPESPLSQTNTVLMRLKRDNSPISGISMQNIPLNFDSQSGSTGGSSTLSFVRQSSQPMQIPEIPPFRRQIAAHPYQRQSPPQTAVVTPSPPRIPEIPPYKPRKSTEWIPPSDVEHHLTIGPGGGAEWARRLKNAVAEPNVHRSTDCIAKELTVSSDSDLLKTAPSWSSVAQTPVESSLASTSAPSVKTALSEEEAKAAEIAAKKSRIKQSLVKRARSVAIFSLKLKERRAREAEKAAQLAVDTAKITNQAPPGGELSVIPIEKLIQVDDVVKQRNSLGQGTM